MIISTPALLISAALLGIGTFAFRAAGPVLHAHITLGPRVQTLMSSAATVLLVSLCATSAIFDGREAADLARPAGVAVAVLLAWRRAPFVVVVLAAAATAAGLRLLGV